MTIEQYLKDNPDFDIYGECELEFADSDSHDEAVENMQWVFDNEPELRALGVVVASYYGGVIDWSRL